MAENLTPLDLVEIEKGIHRMKLLPYHVVTEHMLHWNQKPSLQQITHMEQLLGVMNSIHHLLMVCKLHICFILALYFTKLLGFENLDHTSKLLHVSSEHDTKEVFHLYEVYICSVTAQ